MSRLLWRIAVALLLALIFGTALGYLTLAMWTTHQQETAMLIVLFGVPVVAALLSVWASEATP